MKEATAIENELMTEYAAVRDGGAGVIDLSTRGRIRVTGSEAILFLNGLISNDMKTLAEHRWMPAVFPTVQGRLIGAVIFIQQGCSTQCTTWSTELVWIQSEFRRWFFCSSCAKEANPLRDYVQTPA